MQKRVGKDFLFGATVLTDSDRTEKMPDRYTSSSGEFQLKTQAKTLFPLLKSIQKYIVKNLHFRICKKHTLGQRFKMQLLVSG